MSLDKEAIEALVARGAAAVVRTVETIDDGVNPFLVIPADYKVEDLEKFMPAPTRKRGTFVFEDAQSFISYVNLHKINATAIYATLKEANKLRIPSFAAVIDEHDGDDGVGPRWRSHKASYECQLSDEWKIWIASNKQPIAQEVFAQFIEDNLPDIVRPDGATIMEVAKTLEAKKDVTFKSAIRLENGDVQFAYSEETSGRAGNGTLEIPTEFVIAIPVIVNGPKVEIKARLRYRIPNGTLSFWYDLLRPHKVIDDAFDATWERITKDTDISILYGKGWA